MNYRISPEAKVRITFAVFVLGLLIAWVASAATYETNSNTRTDHDSVTNTHWQSQSFVTASAHTITSIDINLCRNGSPAELQVDLFAVDGAHKPTGSALATSGGVTESTASSCTTYSLVNFPLTTEYELSNATEYAFVIHRTSALNTYELGLNSSQYGAGYSFYDNDSGATWTDDQPFDALFQINGNEIGAGSGTTTATSTEASLVGTIQLSFSFFLWFFIFFGLIFYFKIREQDRN